ncbi:MAG: enoyl-CoA hydratase/isomerase family protein [Hyphomicrobiaceae bacterium]|nr:enoyl-CoA hydratase/isomerase family protein [Hyphomicrobiaceae bacterium]
MTRTYETLAIEMHEPAIAVVRMNREAARNAMNTAMMRDLRDCFMEAYVGQGAVNCFVLTGAGDKAFCAGADLKERKGMSDTDWTRQHAILEQAIRAIMDCPVPVIAAVNGSAFGGGSELALVCDFIYAAESARFAQTEVKLGIIPGAGGTQNMPRATGVRRAKEIVLSGDVFTAAEAHAWGMVNKVVADDRLMDEVLAIARRIAANAPVAVRQAKKALDKAVEIERAAGYQFELEAYYRTVSTQDRIEGINAFNEKRKPVFKGR